MKVGFTGTRNGMTTQQINMFKETISRLKTIEEFHHGDCVGADKEAHDMMKDFIPSECKLHVHPPIDDSLQAHSTADVSYDPLTYLARNRQIVHSVDIMIACPPTNEEIKKGGTWYTINYSRKKGVPVWILYPDGRVELQ